MPLPLSASDISDVLSIYSSPLPIEELSTYIFALDSEFLSEDKPKPQENVESVWCSVVADING